jgi:hypothetical protein
VGTTVGQRLGALRPDRPKESGSHSTVRCRSRCLVRPNGPLIVTCELSITCCAQFSAEESDSPGAWDDSKPFRGSDPGRVLSGTGGNLRGDCALGVRASSAGSPAFDAGNGPGRTLEGRGGDATPAGAVRTAETWSTCPRPSRRGNGSPRSRSPGRLVRSPWARCSSTIWGESLSTADRAV